MVTEIFSTNVGSHMWKMNRPDSDEDMFSCMIMPSTDVWLGKEWKSRNWKDSNNDYQAHEIGKVVDMVKNGNVNFVWGVMSPIIYHDDSFLKELRQITAENLNKRMFHSIHGLVKHNIYHFIDRGDRESLIYKKKLNVIGRTIQYGINLFTYEKCLFEAVSFKSKDDLDAKMIQLAEAFKATSLPETPDEERFNTYLLKVRKWEYDRLVHE